jgi:D-3-phosphoglycerate dehydrogenase
MPDWNILLTDGLEEKGQEILSASAQVDDCNGISAEDLLRTAANYDAIIVRGRTRVTAQVFKAASRLKVVGRAGVGVDNIDLAAANTRNVRVVNSPLATTLAVAEHTLAMMLALARTIPKADSQMKTGQWTKKQLMGVELNGRTLGIIGMGNIGVAVAQRAAALGMKILGHDSLISPDKIRACGAAPTSLMELFTQSDFITLHVPLTPETRNMISGQAFGQMKRGVRLISTARGGLIDEIALHGALESGQVAGAALDVFSSEPPGLTALVSHPNLIATPHIAAQTVEAQTRAAEDIATEVLAALRGEALRWKIV